MEIKRKQIEEVHQRFIHIQPIPLAYYCPQEFPLKSSTKIHLSFLHDFPTNLQQQTNRFFTLAKLKNQ